MSAKPPWDSVVEVVQAPSDSDGGPCRESPSIKVQKDRVVVWSKTDKRGNETAFASIDMRAPEASESSREESK